MFFKDYCLSKNVIALHFLTKQTTYTMSKARQNKENPAEKKFRLALDDNWKFLIENNLEDFTAIFLPDLHGEIDYSVKPIFLEQEFRSTLRPFHLGKKFTDKIIKVRLKTGVDKLILIHVEVQHEAEDDFSERMYIYYTLIFLKYRLDITAIAVFTNKEVPPNRGIFRKEAFGTSIEYRYNSVWSMDKTEEALSASENIFDLALLTMRYLGETKNNMRKRLLFKKKLAELAVERNFSNDRINSFLIFVDEILKLSEDFKIAYEIYFNELKLKSEKMPTTKKKYVPGDNLRNAIFKHQYGITIQEFESKFGMTIEEIAQHKTIAQQEKPLEQVKSPFEHSLIQGVLNLYFEKKWDIPTIADVFNLDVEKVKKIIASKKW